MLFVIAGSKARRPALDQNKSCSHKYIILLQSTGSSDTDVVAAQPYNHPNCGFKSANTVLVRFVSLRSLPSIFMSQV